MTKKISYVALLGITTLTFNVHCGQSMQDTIPAQEIPDMQGLHELRDIPFPFREEANHLEVSKQHSLDWLKENKELSAKNKAYIANLFSRIQDQKLYSGSLTHYDKYFSILVYTAGAEHHAESILRQLLGHYRALAEANSEVGLENICFANPDDFQRNGQLKIEEFVNYHHLHGLTHHHKRAWDHIRFIQDANKNLASHIGAHHSPFSGTLAAIIYDRKVRVKVPYGMYMSQHLLSAVKRLK